METVKLERKKLKRYKILKLIAAILSILFIIYNIYWFLAVYPKNEKLSDWNKTESNYYLKKDNYIFQSHSLKYLEPYIMAIYLSAIIEGQILMLQLMVIIFMSVYTVQELLYLVVKI